MSSFIVKNAVKTTGSIRILFWTVFWLFGLLLFLEILFLTSWPWRFSDLEPYLLRKESDNWTHNAFEIERIKRLERSDYDEIIVFLGGSISLEAIDRDTIISRRLTEITGSRMLFKSLCASFQTFADTAKIIHSLGNLDGIILVGIEPLSFKSKPSSQLTERLKNGHLHLKYYFLTPPPVIVDTLSKQSLKSNIYHNTLLFRNSQTLGEIAKKRILSPLVSGNLPRPIQYDRHAVGDRTPVDEKKRERQSRWLGKLLKQYHRFFALNLDILTQSIRIAEEQKNRVILVDLPDNPIFEKEISRFNPHYDNMIRDLIRNTGSGYIDLRSAADWKPEDFRDVHHMRSSGRKKITRCLSNSLAQYLSGVSR